MLHCGHNSAADKKWTDSRIPIRLHNVLAVLKVNAHFYTPNKKLSCFLYLLKVSKMVSYTAVIRDKVVVTCKWL